MQVGTRFSFLQQAARMAELQAATERTQAQIASGKRILEASDDPLGAARVAQLTRTLADNAQYRRNLDTATTRLSLGETALDGVSNALVRAQELALAAASGTYSAADRLTIAAEVRQLTDEMFALANARDAQGAYVFAGATSGAPAFARDVDGMVQWQGSGAAAKIAIGPDASVAASDSGADLFARVQTADGPRSVFAMLEQLVALTDPDPLTPPDPAGFDAVLAGLGDAVGHIADARAGFGVRLARLDRDAERLAAADVDITVEKTGIEGVDVATAITEMQRTLLALQASQQSFAQIKRMSLFDYLR